MTHALRTPINWQARAFNQVVDSSNQIHSDAMAQAYGFKGALVPGVTISSYLMHPAVLAWETDWLSRGWARVVVNKPLYDAYEFEVQVSDVSANAYRAELIDQEGTRVASGDMRLTDDLPTPPKRRGDPYLVRGATVPDVSRTVLEGMQTRGMGALPVSWDAVHPMATYLVDMDAMPALLRFDGAGYANGAFMLGLSNWVLAGNVYMNPWVHLQTESQFFAPVSSQTELIVECAVADLFDRRGHQFVDARVDVYRAEDDTAVMTALLRAIYRLRPPAEPAD